MRDGKKLEEVKSKGLLRVLQGSKSDYQALKGGGILMMLAFSEMINSSSFKAKLGKGPFIEMVSSMFEQSEQ